MTIDRMDNAVGYHGVNCASCCYVCNRIKSNFFTADEMKKIGQLFVHPKWDVFNDDVWNDFSNNLI